MSLGTEPVARRFLSLVGWTGFREFLRSIPPREELGMGNILAGRRILQLDHHAVDPSPVDDQRFDACFPGGTRPKSVLGLHLRSALGAWWTYVRPDHALPRDVPGNGRGARLHGCLRHAYASHFPRAVRDGGSSNELGFNDSARSRNLPRWNRLCRYRRNIQRKGDVREAEASLDQRVQPEKGIIGGHVFGSDER